MPRGLDAHLRRIRSLAVAHPRYSIAAAVVVVLGAVGGTLAALGGGSSPARSTPAVVRISGLPAAGVQASGVFEDGWLQQNATLALGGGRAGNLVLQLQVPLQPLQHLRVSVDGRLLTARAVKPGPLTLRLPVPAASATRNVQIHWDRAVRLAPPDERMAAAQLTYAGVALPPAGLRFPDGLTAPGTSTTGIYEDGWSRQVAHVQLAAGAAGMLVVRAEIPKGVRQQLTLRVGGKKVGADTLPAGTANVRVPVPASSSTRDVELQWAKTFPLAAPDNRRASAQLDYVGIATPPAVVSIPSGLANPGLTSSGVYSDGWLRQASSLVLAGGGAGNLILEANVPQQAQQTLTVMVNGIRIASDGVDPGKLDLQLPIPASSSPRTVKLEWSHAIRLGANDTRLASAQLTRIAVAAPPLEVVVPDGLRNPGLTASGVYPDGWLKQDASVTLAGGAGGNLVVQANVPAQSGLQLTVTLDGSRLLSKAVQPGKLDLRLPVPATTSSRVVQLHWSQTIALAAPDTRLAAAQLTRIGIVLPPRSVTVPAGLSDPGLTTSGVYADGWLRQTSSLVLAGGKAGTLAISADLPGSDKAELRVSIDGQQVADRVVRPGKVQVSVLVGASSSPRRISLHWSRTEHLAAPDTRTASARLRSIAIR